MVVTLLLKILSLIFILVKSITEPLCPQPLDVPSSTPLHYCLYFLYFYVFFLLLFFKTRFLCVTALAVLELAPVDQDGLELIEICLYLTSEYWLIYFR